ncbi:MAG: PilN domain-containing protein [Rhizomicrobium sp.]
MNAKDLLNLDMETLARLLLQFWRWWTDELLAMLPPEWRERLSKRSRIIAQLNSGTIVYSNADNGQILPEKPRGAIRFLLPADRVLVRHLDLPLLPISDVKRMIGLDIDRLTPFQPEQIYFDADIVSRDPENGRQDVALGVVPREVAQHFISLLQEKKLVPASIGVAPSANAAALDFDFLSSMRDAQGSDVSQQRSLYWWAAAVVLLVVNIAFAAYRDSSNVDALRDAVDAQQTPVAIALRTRDKVGHEAAQRALLLQNKKRMSPLPVLDAVTKAMPMDAWVSRFEWNGRTVHVRGQRKTSNDIIARLEASPVLRNARSLSTETRASDSNGAQQFDLSADREFAKGAP